MMAFSLLFCFVFVVFHFCFTSDFYVFHLYETSNKTLSLSLRSENDGAPYISDHVPEDIDCYVYRSLSEDTGEPLETFSRGLPYIYIYIYLNIYIY
jgi:hypothetical protein